MIDNGYLLSRHRPQEFKNSRPISYTGRAEGKPLSKLVVKSDRYRLSCLRHFPKAEKFLSKASHWGALVCPDREEGIF